MDVTGILSSITAAISLAKELKAVDNQLDQADLKLKIAELTSALAEAKMGIIDISVKISEQKAEINRLLDIQTDLSDKIFFEGFWMDAFDDQTPRGDPYCPYCIARKSGIFRLAESSKIGVGLFCPHCRTEYANAPRYLYERG